MNFTSTFSLGFTVACLLTACGDPPGKGPTTTTAWETSTTEAEASSDSAETGPPEPICLPGDRRCTAEAVEECAPTGLEWVAGEDCGNYGVCASCVDEPDCDQVRCATPCDVKGRVPSSEGCSFFATRLLEGDNTNGTRVHSVIVANPDPTRVAKVQLYKTKEGTREEVEQGDPVDLAPGQANTFALDAEPIVTNTSLLRAGGVFRVESDIPVVAYLHGPGNGGENGGDASLLLPEETFRTDFVVPSYAPRDRDIRWPSYFVVIALEDDTQVTWTAKRDTFGNGAPIPYVAEGETATVSMNRFDNMRVAASITAYPLVDAHLRDVSGAYIHSSKPVAVFSGVTAASIPKDAWTSDHLQEQVIPLQYWGREYVGAATPVRGGLVRDEYWRIFAGADNVTITTNPPQPGTPVTLATRGDFAELLFPPGTSAVFSGDKPFMPVHYIASNTFSQGEAVTANGGDPSMYQIVPTEQYLSRYVFATGANYATEYVQIIRPAAGPEVRVDGTPVTGYYTIGTFEVADWVIAEGTHTAESDGDFGIYQVAYAEKASYAYPGGIKAEEIFLP